MRNRYFIKIKGFLLLILLVIIVSSCIVYYNFVIYNSIKVSPLPNIAVEYGSKDFNIKKYLKSVNGEVVNIKNNINSKVLGEQEVTLEVLRNNVSRDVPIIVNVIDSIAPCIKIKEEVLTVYKGDKVDLLSNVLEVYDKVDGIISFSSDTTSDNKGYYSFDIDEDIRNIGSHEIVINAYDRTGNSSKKSFVLNVLEKKGKSVPVIYKDDGKLYSSNDLVNLAISFVGAPYIAGGNGPHGFDCSGFVQFIYSKIGKKISRSTSTQFYDGEEVSYTDALPGDIICLGYFDGIPSHSALYIGNGQMIHATNPKQGVVISDIAGWIRGSGTKILSVRRIN